MKNQLPWFVVIVAGLLCSTNTQLHANHPPLWYYAYVNLESKEALGDGGEHTTDEMVHVVLPRLQQLGYRSIVLSSYGLHYLEDLRKPNSISVANLKRINDKATELGIEIIPEVMTVGSSGPILQNGPEYAEAFPVKKCVYKVIEASDGSLQAVAKDDSNAYRQGSFESCDGGHPSGDYYVYYDQPDGRFLKPSLVADPVRPKNQVLRIQYCTPNECQSNGRAVPICSADTEQYKGWELGKRGLDLTSGTKCHRLYSINVQPRRQYRLSFRIRTKELQLDQDDGFFYTQLTGDDVGRSAGYKLHHVGLRYQRGTRPSPAQGDADTTTKDAPSANDTLDPLFQVFEDQEWTRYTIAINTFHYNRVMFSFGMGGVTGGTLWLDDVKLTQATAYNLLRRPDLPNVEEDDPNEGLPIRIRLADGSKDGQPLEENVDFHRWSDPAPNCGGSYPHDKPSIPIKIKRNGGVSAGDELWVDYYHAQTTTQETHRVSVSLRHPKVHSFFKEQVQLIHHWIKPKRWLVNHDELWMAGHDPLGKNTTPLQSLGGLLEKCLQIVDSVCGQAIVVSDMYDPHHNASDKSPNESFYPFIKGSFSGSWAYLPNDVAIWNWSMGEERIADGRDTIEASFRHFHRLGLPQIVGGYYDVTTDPDDVQSEAEALFRLAKENGDITGLCFYTTRGAVCYLDRFAAAAKEVWSEQCDPDDGNVDANPQKGTDNQLEQAKR
ncbi:MAG: hypothetical protein AAGC97_00270 [Planctomycetota bacterium]